ncbi:MAG TPA: phenylalanine--tRNA ligase subunit beta, partial [Gammaproteobacteria bacterium]|nr:phenylalanine--tRNA ligase subunit beta [Gammaproteobacteria bacterium]
AGLEVDAVEPVAPAFSGVVVAEIISAEPHPDADKLQVCRVDAGQDEPLQIVCGASNARAGIKVPAALVGAVLPGDFKIKKAKLRGVASFGMLCSAKELGLAEEAAGLFELPSDAEPGDDLRDYLQLDDVTIELGLTPNRGDCLSLEGVAREVGVLNRLPLQVPAVAPAAVENEHVFPVVIESAEACPRYAGRVIRNIDPTVETPLWMRERLRRSGLRSLSAVVDVTNYVMLELGQPMHAFDLAKLTGGIQVRMARPQEMLMLLNEQQVTLRENSLVIADQNGPVALAGIMGGAASAVSDTSRDIFLESAFFSPAVLAGQARSYGLHTDSSHRFERGVAPDLQVRALERATELLLGIVGGEAGPVTDIAVAEQLPRSPTIFLRDKQISRVLGTSIAGSETEQVLSRLGMDVRQLAEGWQVTPPGYRFDIAIEADLIEELARIHGYDKLPSVRPVAALTMRTRPETRLPMETVRHILTTRGYQEVITYSFVDPEIQRLLTPDCKPVALANPISS